jgi:hypothetical protein
MANRRVFLGRDPMMLEDSNAVGWHLALSSSQWPSWGIDHRVYASMPLPRDVDHINRLVDQYPGLVVEHGHARKDYFAGVTDQATWISSMEYEPDLPNHAYYPGDWLRNIIMYRAHRYNADQPTRPGIITVRNQTEWKDQLLSTIHTVPGRSNITTAVWWDRPDLGIRAHRLPSEQTKFDRHKSPAVGCRERGDALSIIVAEERSQDLSEKWYQAMTHPAIVLHWSHDHRSLIREWGFDVDYEGIPDYYNQDGTINHDEFRAACEQLWDWPHSMDIWRTNHKRIQHNMAQVWRRDVWHEYCRKQWIKIGLI